MPTARHENGEVKRSINGRPLYICDNCGRLEPWNNNWAWYGSYRQLEDYGLEGIRPVKTICSPECRVALVAKGKMPDEGLDDGGNVASV